MVELLTQPAEVLLVKKALAECTSGRPSNLTDDVITYQQLQVRHNSYHMISPLCLYIYI